MLPKTPAAVGLALILLLGAPTMAGSQDTTSVPAPPVAVSRDVASLVDIGGRSLYLECRGQGSPTVILESGLGSRFDIWSRDAHDPTGQRTMVLPGVATLTRVCAYDRPGTIGVVDPGLDPDGPWCGCMPAPTRTRWWG